MNPVVWWVIGGVAVFVLVAWLCWRQWGRITLDIVSDLADWD